VNERWLLYKNLGSNIYQPHKEFVFLDEWPSYGNRFVVPMLPWSVGSQGDLLIWFLWPYIICGLHTIESTTFYAMSIVLGPIASKIL
jgi:hypothetical protein